MSTRSTLWPNKFIEWADASEGDANPEVGGDSATESLTVTKAGIKSVNEGRHVDVAEVLARDD